METGWKPGERERIARVAMGRKSEEGKEVILTKRRARQAVSSFSG